MNYLQLKEDNEDLIYKLKDNWKTNALDIEHYLKVKLKSKYRVELVMYDILNMFLEYQNLGEKVEDVVGEDVKEFCDEILINVEKVSLKDRIIEFCNRYMGTIIFFISFDFLAYRGEFPKFESIWTYKIPFKISIIFTYLIFFVVFHIGNNIFRKYGTPKSREKSQIFMYIALGIVLVVYYKISRIFKLPDMLIGINIIVAIIIIALCIILKMYSKNYIDNKVGKKIK